MIQSHSKQHKCSAGRILFHAFAFVSLAKYVTGATEDSIPQGSKVQRDLQWQPGLSITTPRFGGCDSPTDRLSCAIKPSNCPDGTQYIRSGDLEINKCETPHRVEVGRCMSSTGNTNHCSAYSTSCENPSDYTESDPTCSLVEDKSDSKDGLTQYPYCRKTIEGGNPLMVKHRCVLSGDECISGEEELLTFDQTTNFMRCFCHVVPIGMCFVKDELKTTDTTYCSVASYDCKDGYEFMPAFELDELLNPPRTCRLCDLKDLAFFELHQSVVESGRCVATDGDYGNCELESTACPTFYEFQSSMELRSNGVMGCSAEVFDGGDCKADQGEAIHCTNIAEACAPPAQYTKRSTCTVHHDSLNDEPMYFGQCNSLTGESSEGRDYRCVWQSSECDSTNEEYRPASKPMDWYDGCTCENVVTGACQDPNSGEYYCAVSEFGCASNHKYITSLETQEVDIELDCRLCQRSRMPKSTNPTFGPTKNPTSSPTKPPTRTPSFNPTKSALTFAPTRAIDKDDDTNDDDDTDRYTFAPTPTARNFDDDDDGDDDNNFIVPDDDGNGDDYDDDYDDDDGDVNDNDDEYDDDFLNDDNDNVGQYDTAIIISGSVGGTLVFTCIAILFYYRKPLPPVKLYVTDEDKDKEVV